MFCFHKSCPKETIFFGIVILFSTLHVKSGNGMMRAFGDTCGPGDPCLGSQVICLVSGICDCVHPDEMTYDQSSETCFIKLGQRCRESSECFKGAECISGICKCDAGFFPSPDGSLCNPKKMYREFCASDAECGWSVNRWDQAHQRQLKCLNGLCLCDKKHDIYDSTKEICVGLVDTECFGDFESCTQNAVCLPSLNNSSRMSCRCSEGFARDSYMECAKSYGQMCGKLDKCADTHFTCIDGICKCKYPLHQVYEEKTSECLSLVSGPCTFPKNTQMNLATVFRDFQKCVKNAHCVDKENYSECECKPGFVVTRSGTCAPGYGRPCDPGDCDPDNLSGLFCRNGVCDCLDLFQVYDSSIKTCRGLVGSRCTVEKPACVEFASCVVPDQKLPGKCLCDKYSVETPNRTCDYRVR